MIRNLIVCTILALAGFLCLPANAEDAISHPAKKPIGPTTNEMIPSLAVLNARGATLEGNKLTLTGVTPTPSCSPTARYARPVTC
jgi:hypothetical protein